MDGSGPELTMLPLPGRVGGSRQVEQGEPQTLGELAGGLAGGVGDVVLGAGGGEDGRHVGVTGAGLNRPPQRRGAVAVARVHVGAPPDQHLGHLRQVLLGGEVQRRPALLVLGVDVGPGLQQQAQHAHAAAQHGGEDGRAPVIVPGIGVGALGQQLPHPDEIAHEGGVDQGPAERVGVGQSGGHQVREIRVDGAGLCPAESVAGGSGTL